MLSSLPAGAGKELNLFKKRHYLRKYTVFKKLADLLKNCCFLTITSIRKYDIIYVN